MKTRFAVRFLPVLLMSCLLAPGCLLAQAGRQVSIPSGNETVGGLLFQPKGEAHGKRPGLIVIHEWWGLNDWIKEQAQQFADQGYVALAVDLFRGQVATDPQMAHELTRGVPQDRGVRDLVAAANWLAKQPDVDPNRIGAIGWCWGGGFAAQLAVADPSLKAVVINYGALPTDKSALERIHARVLGNFGGLDRGITPDDVHAFEAAMQSLGKPVDAKIYPDAGRIREPEQCRWVQGRRCRGCGAEVERVPERAITSWERLAEPGRGAITTGTAFARSRLMNSCNYIANGEGGSCSRSNRVRRR